MAARLWWTNRLCLSLAYLASQFVLDLDHVSIAGVPLLGVIKVVDPLRYCPLRMIGIVVALTIE
jgi:hypothetical protein